jgi:hypothetical protein
MATSRSSVEGIKCATVRARVRVEPDGAPDNEQRLSGAPPDCPVVQKTEAPTVGIQRFGDVAGAPDSVLCTRDSNFELVTFGNSGGRSAIIHRTVWCSTGQCPVAHRTVRCDSGAMATSRQRSSVEGIKCATVRARVRVEPDGAPDNEQRLSGAPPDCPVAQKTEAPTVGIQRFGDVAGAPDSVRCTMRQQPSPNG